MYEYVTDRKFISQMKKSCGNLMQELSHQLKKDYDIGTNFFMVGSGARNLILQNGNAAIDLDYNLELTRCEYYNDCSKIKENVRKTFNKVLEANKLPDCEDSKSALTTKKFYIKNNRTLFSIDVAIVCRNQKGNYCRLIHEKTGYRKFDKYYWNEIPNSIDIKRKAQEIKEFGLWLNVREQYKNIKNYCICNNDKRPSFTCYVEAVNNVYNTLNQKKPWR